MREYVRDTAAIVLQVQDRLTRMNALRAQGARRYPLAEGNQDIMISVADLVKGKMTQINRQERQVSYTEMNAKHGSFANAGSIWTM